MSVVFWIVNKMKEPMMQDFTWGIVVVEHYSGFFAAQQSCAMLRMTEISSVDV